MNTVLMREFAFPRICEFSEILKFMFALQLKSLRVNNSLFRKVKCFLQLGDTIGRFFIQVQVTIFQTRVLKRKGSQNSRA